jgi:hypothetical protein
MHYKRVKNFKYENSYTYFVKLSRIENTKKTEQNIKRLLLAKSHEHYKTIPNGIKRVVDKVMP